MNAVRRIRDPHRQIASADCGRWFGSGGGLLFAWIGVMTYKLSFTRTDYLLDVI